MLEIRFAEERDLEFLKSSYSLLDKTMNALMKQLRNIEEDEGGQHPDKYWLQLIQQKKGYVLVAAQDSIPAGMAVVLELGDFEAHLEDLLVWPDFRKQGIGEALVKEAKRVAIKKDYRCMSLNVLPNNDSARKLYRKEGFGEVKISMYCQF